MKIGEQLYEYEFPMWELADPKEAVATIFEEHPEVRKHFKTEIWVSAGTRLANASHKTDREAKRWVEEYVNRCRKEGDQRSTGELAAELIPLVKKKFKRIYASTTIPTWIRESVAPHLRKRGRPPKRT